MAHALRLAARGLGAVWPNPAVGCVLVRDGLIVGRGWTQPGGRPHAETGALAQAGALAQGATAYVTLEPCAHHGQTPPCAEGLIAARVARVVTALTDPDPRVAGRGHAMLRAAGIAVTEGVLAAEASRINAGFLKRISRNLPFVTLKLATTLDGRIATATGESRWITGPAARRHTHLLRLTHDAVMVGAGTARADDPDLTVRDIVAVFESHKVDVGDWVVLEQLATHRLMLTTHSDMPEPTLVRIEMRESHNGVDWTTWRRVAHFYDVQSAGVYYQQIPFNGLLREVRVRGEQYALDGAVAVV